KLLFVVALSRASEHIFFSRTPSNERGVYLAGSHFLQKILGKVSSLERIPYYKDAPSSSTWDNPKIFEISYEPSHYYEESLIPYISNNSNSSQISDARNYIKIIEKTNKAYQEETQIPAEGAQYFGILSPKNKFTLDFNQPEISISSTGLESLGRCRYKGLWERLCRLKPYVLPTYHPENIDYGNLYHSVLEDYIKETKHLSAAECLDLSKLKEILNKFITQSSYEQVFRIDYEYILTILTNYLQTQEKSFREDQDPLFFEVSSGNNELSNNIININKEISLQIKSKIDRVDQNKYEDSYQIIDYKKRGSSYKNYQKIPFNLFQGFLYASLLSVNGKNPVNKISYVLLENNETFQEFPNKKMNSITEFTNFKKEEVASLIKILKNGDFSPYTTSINLGEELLELFHTYINDKKTPTEYESKCAFCEYERICLRKNKLTKKY
ncbi:MAG: PD-(D/E)XK nuclease family protein, partial [Brevinema sp.]